MAARWRCGRPSREVTLVKGRIRRASEHNFSRQFLGRIWTNLEQITLADPIDFGENASGGVHKPQYPGQHGMRHTLACMASRMDGLGS